MQVLQTVLLSAQVFFFWAKLRGWKKRGRTVGLKGFYWEAFSALNHCLSVFTTSLQKMSTRKYNLYWREERKQCRVSRHTVSARKRRTKSLKGLIIWLTELCISDFHNLSQSKSLFPFFKENQNIHLWDVRTDDWIWFCYLTLNAAHNSMWPFRRTNDFKDSLCINWKMLPVVLRPSVTSVHSVWYQKIKALAAQCTLIIAVAPAIITGDLLRGGK